MSDQPERLTYAQIASKFNWRVTFDMAAARVMAELAAKDAEIARLRNVEANLLRMLGYGPEKGMPVTVAVGNLLADNARLRELHAGACERIAAASEVIAKCAERNALARLEAWAGERTDREVNIDDIGGWEVALRQEQDSPSGIGVLAYGYPDPANRDPDPDIVYLHGAASLAECIIAALDLWQKLYGEGG